MNPENKQYRLLVKNLPDAYACLHITTGSDGEPEDCVLVEINPAFEAMAGLNRPAIIGLPAADIMPAPEQGKLDWTGIYLLAKTTGEAVSFKQYSPLLDSWHSVTAYSDRPGYLSVIFHHIIERQKYEKELQESKEQFRSLVENLNEVFFVLDNKTRFSYISPNITNLSGHSPSEIIGRSILDFIHPEEVKEVSAQLCNKNLGFQEPVEYRLITKNKLQEVWVRITSSPTYRENELIGIQGVLTNITEQKQAEQSFKSTLEKYQQILSTIEEGYYEIDMSGRLSFFNNSFCQIVGYKEEELLNSSYKVIFKNPGEVFKSFKRVYRTGKPEKAAGWPVITKEGKEIYVEASVSLLRKESGGITGFKGIVRDITGRKRYEEKLKYLSFHDHLTGLYNRAFFVEEMDRLSASREHPITIISADLDKLKLINDTMGHSKGDQLLKACAQVLEKSLRSSDILARVGGDEFAVILPRTDKQTGAEIAARIQANADAYNREHPDLPMSMSCGLYTATTDDMHLEEAFKIADNQMMRDKLTRRSATNRELIELLVSALDRKDHLANGHAERLTIWCTAMGKKLGLSSNQLALLKLLARIHDLGKVAVPDNILFKEGPLDNIEWDNMKQHPEKGKAIATTLPEYAGVANLIHKHHERWDGCGYPSGLKGDQIPIEGRILAIADAFDVMTTDRPYRMAMSKEEAVNEIKACAGKQFDPELVQIFLGVIENK